jgi:hypothetical protein
MWTAARSLAALDGRLPPRYRDQVEFRAPILLPGEVEFVDRVRSGGSDGVEYQVRASGNDRLHLLGAVTEV